MAAEKLLATLTPAQLSEFERVKAIALGVAPDAELAVSYGLLALKYRGKGLLAWAVGKHFYSLYPFGKGVVEQMAGELAGYEGTPGSVHYPFDRPMPAELIEKMTRLKKARVDALNS